MEAVGPEEFHSSDRRCHHFPRRFSHDYERTDSVLGSGVQGEVFVARSRRTGARFAVKQFAIRNLSDAGRRRAENEAEVLRRMDHPHIARLVDSYQSDEHLDLVIECMEGGELFHRLTKRKYFSERDAARAAWQMLLAVNYLHSEGVVHRDLKMENFLYESNRGNHLKLIDFGFAVFAEPGETLSESCGTKGYVAPEVLRGLYNSKSDVWSLGVIVFVLLSGYMPVTGHGSYAAGEIDFSGKRWQCVCPDARDFVGRLLSGNPAARPTAEEALQHPWVMRHNAPSTLGSGMSRATVDALLQFAQASPFRRACMCAMAWSVTGMEHAKVRGAFIELDQTKNGSISLWELRAVLTRKFGVSNEQVEKIFETLDESIFPGDNQISYSEFLAAMCMSRIEVQDSHLKETFRRFDLDGSGYITLANLQGFFAGPSAGRELEYMLAEANPEARGRVSSRDFAAYLRGGVVVQGNSWRRGACLLAGPLKLMSAAGRRDATIRRLPAAPLPIEDEDKIEDSLYESCVSR